MYVERSMTVDKCNTNYMTFIGYKGIQNKSTPINSTIEFLLVYLMKYLKMLIKTIKKY